MTDQDGGSGGVIDGGSPGGGTGHDPNLTRNSPGNAGGYSPPGK